MLKTIGGIRERTQKDGTPYYEIRLKELPDFPVKVMVFENNDKKEDWHDDYRICESLPEEKITPSHKKIMETLQGQQCEDDVPF